jgi:hypothetical protein
MECPGSVGLIRSTQKEMLLLGASSYALEGTAMHRAGELWLSSGQEPDWVLYQWEGIELDEEMADAVKLYVEVLRADQANYGGELVVEKQFRLDRLREHMWGTNDALLIRCRDNVLRVYDFKGGRGIVVEVKGNRQLRYYAYGALLNLPGLNVEQVEIVIVQPRAKHPDGPVRRERIDVIDLYDWSMDLLRAAQATDDPNAPLHAGPWCRFCPAAGVCTEVRDWTAHQAALDFEVVPMPTLPDPRVMTPEQIAAMLDRLDYVEEYAGLVRAAAHAMAERGIVVPGRKLVMKRGKRHWIDDDRAVVASLHEAGVSDDKIFETKLRTPAALEKLLPKALRGIIAKLAQMVSSGTSLARLDDTRAAVPAQGFAAFPELLPAAPPVELVKPND